MLRPYRICSPYRNSLSVVFLVREGPFPVLPFLVFLEFLVFSPCEEFLVFLSVLGGLSHWECLPKMDRATRGCSSYTHTNRATLCHYRAHTKGGMQQHTLLRRVLSKPCPSFPCFFFGIPCFFSPCEEFLVFLSVFPLFSRDFRGSVGIKNPCFVGGFPCLFPKKQGKEGQGRSRPSSRKNSRKGFGRISCELGSAILNHQRFAICDLEQLGTEAPAAAKVPH